MSIIRFHDNDPFDPLYYFIFMSITYTVIYCTKWRSNNELTMDVKRRPLI